MHSKNINQFKKDKFLDFLTIETNRMPDNNYEMKIIFAGDSMIRIISEVIEVTLDDQGDAWYANGGSGIVNMSFSGSKEIQISDSFALPVFGSFILNPDAEAAFLVFGVSF